MKIFNGLKQKNCRKNWQRLLAAGCLAVTFAASPAPADAATYARYAKDGTEIGFMNVVETPFGMLASVTAYDYTGPDMDHATVKRFVGTGYLDFKYVHLTHCQVIKGGASTPLYYSVYYTKEAKGKDLLLHQKGMESVPSDPEMAGTYKYLNDDNIIDPGMGRLLLDDLPGEMLTVDLSLSRYNCAYVGYVDNPQSLSAEIDTKTGCYKYEVYEMTAKSGTLAVTYLVTEDLKEAYRIMPNGEVLQIYNEGGLG